MGKKNSPFLYIDIDGVLLGHKNPGDSRVSIANHAEDFLDFALCNFRCFWLSTHGKDGNLHSILRVFRRHSSKISFLEKVAAISPAPWKTLKVDAINMDSDFYWIDDTPLQVEIQRLEMMDCGDRLILVNTRIHPDDLLRARQILEQKIRNG